MARLRTSAAQRKASEGLARTAARMAGDDHAARPAASARFEHRLNPCSLRASALRISSAGLSAWAVVGHQAAPSVMSMVGWRHPCAEIGTSAQKLFSFRRRRRAVHPTGFNLNSAKTPQEPSLAVQQAKK